MYKEGFKKLHATEGIFTLYNEDATGMHIIINIHTVLQREFLQYSINTILSGHTTEGILIL